MKESSKLIYTHFVNNYAVRQIEISDEEIIYLDEDKPVYESSMLYDGKFDELEIEDDQFISQSEFEKVWQGSIDRNE